MRRVVVVKVEFEIDEENANEMLDTPLTDDELLEYAKQTFVEDISTMVIHNEVHRSVRATIEERE